MEDIVISDKEGVFIQTGEMITADAAKTIEKAGHQAIAIRSPVTCQSIGGICATCYGVDLANGQPPRKGLAAGVLAAQSIGEPVTQLTMRTFYLFTRTPGDPKNAKINPDIISGIIRLDQLMEAWSNGDSGEEEHKELCELYDRAGASAVAEALRVEMQKIYRAQGVQINDHHFEVVLSRMLSDGKVKGVSEAAAETEDFIAAGSTHNGIDTLVNIAARNQPIILDKIRNCTAFGKRMPSLMDSE